MNFQTIAAATLSGVLKPGSNPALIGGNINNDQKDVVEEFFPGAIDEA